jgi:hypothetical protein
LGEWGRAMVLKCAMPSRGLNASRAGFSADLIMGKSSPVIA